jgi:hypothetical protein
MKPVPFNAHIFWTRFKKRVAQQRPPELSWAAFGVMDRRTSYCFTGDVWRDKLRAKSG